MTEQDRQAPDLQGYLDEIDRLFAEGPAAREAGLVQRPLVSLVDGAPFRGAPDSPACGVALLEQIIDELPEWSAGALSFATAEDFSTRAEALAVQSVIAIGIVDVQHRALRPDVVASIEDAASKGEPWKPAEPAAELVEERDLFAVALLVPEIAISGVVEFEVGGDFYVGNRVDTPTVFEIDPDDGGGWRSVKPGDRLRVEYSSGGDKNIAVRACYPGDTKRHGNALCKIVEEKVPRWDAEWPIEARYEEEPVKGTVFVWYAEGRTHIEKPLILLSGFDPRNRFTPCMIYHWFNQEEMLSDARRAGFDIVHLHYGDAGTYIQANALLLETLLTQLGEQPPKKQPGALFSASMGGLIGRYALAHMESQELDHGIAAHCSVDTPHTGAVVPMAVQFFVDSFARIPYARQMRDVVLDSIAARQMLLVRYREGWHREVPFRPGSDPAFEAFYKDLKRVGNYPKKVRNLAVASGPGDGSGQAFRPGEPLLEFRFGPLVGASPFKALPEVGKTEKIFSGTLGTTWHGTVAGGEALDSVAGGTGDFVDQVYKGIRDVFVTRAGTLKLYHGATCFIPAVSAVGQEAPYDAPVKDVSELPFDAIFCEAKNHVHIQVSRECALWIKQQLGFVR